MLALTAWEMLFLTALGRVRAEVGVAFVGNPFGDVTVHHVPYIRAGQGFCGLRNDCVPPVVAPAPHLGTNSSLTDVAVVVVVAGWTSYYYSIQSRRCKVQREPRLRFRSCRTAANALICWVPFGQSLITAVTKVCFASD